MKKRICVLGIPGVGKSTICSKLSKRLDALWVDVPRLVKENGLHLGYDRRARSYIVNVAGVRRHLAEIASKRERPLVVSSHFAVSIPRFMFDVVIVLRCNPLKLIKRLRRRGYGAGKIRDNVVSELIGISFWDAREVLRRSKIKEVDVSNLTPSRAVSGILEELREESAGLRRPKIDWISELEKGGGLDDLMDYLSARGQDASMSPHGSTCTT